MKRISFVSGAVTLCVVVFTCAGCPFGRYRLPEMVPVEPADPVEDFLRIRKLFHDHGGEMVTREDKVATWKDTRLFRRYEFKHHTVIVFPYNWRDKGFLRKEGFNLIIFAGHVRPEVNSFDAVQAWGTDSNGVDWHLDEPSLRDVSFEGFRLGEDRTATLQREEALIAALYPRDEVAVREARIRMLTGIKDYGSGVRPYGQFILSFKEQKLAHMEFTQISGPSLGSLGLYEPVTPVIAEGTFEIPAREGDGD